MAESQNRALRRQSSSPIMTDEVLDDLMSHDATLDELLGQAAIGDDSLQPYVSNAVHMEIQENAKLPTFNLTVDRSNSVRQHKVGKLHKGPPLPPQSQSFGHATEKDLDEMMKLAEIDDVKLSEFFLDSTDRSSQNQMYRGVPIAYAEKPTAKTKPGESAVMAASTAADDKSVTTSPKPPPVAVAPKTPAPKDTLTNSHSHMLHHYRSEPLPIPKVKVPAPAPSDASPSPSMAAALATAAALASATSGPTPVAAVPASAASVATKRFPKNPLSAPPIRPRTAQSKQPTTKAGAMTNLAPTPSVIEATRQRAQFGFGQRHVVPTVPAPPRPAATSKPKQRTPAASPTAKSPTGAARSSPLPPSVSNTGGAAYERKKQRAKDARVKLNEAIEQLSVAISVAGTQSQQRKKHFIGSFSRISQVLTECAMTAESAKKWERPSFVGTAASLVQGLNAQCEALLAEVLTLRQALAKTNGSSTNGLNHHHYPGAIPASKRPASLAVASNGKRQRTTDQHSGASRFSILLSLLVLQNGEKIWERMASFLDPLSLVRCRQWQRKTRNRHSPGSSLEENLWLGQAIARFGPVAVRQTKEERGDNISSLNLYRAMDVANVSPTRNLGEGTAMTTLLGEGRIPGKVSAWVFLVERSNGETSRSVLRNDDSGTFTSQPVVELRMLLQNTGLGDSCVDIRPQTFGVDASTRRRGEEWKEITWYPRLQRRWTNLDGFSVALGTTGGEPSLRLCDSVVLHVHILTKGCSTLAKFQQRANSTKILVGIHGTTLPLVIPFLRESSSVHH